tara:strand:+ start:1605 stop:3032 length:1428 start_codon:yes stop_codon:yes gene_type:complete
LDTTSLIKFGYLISAVFFILGLKNMTHPRTAVRGNLLGAFGMLLAVLLALLGDKSVVRYELIAIGAVLGGLIGTAFAARVQMTAMPQLVAMFNGFGGGASVLVAGAELVKVSADESMQAQLVQQGMGSAVLIAIAASGSIGAITFWGSLIAFAKLQEIKAFRKPISLPGQQVINILLATISFGVVAYLVWAGFGSLAIQTFFIVVCLTSVLGLCLVNPIGGADMPVVIALLNSYSGLAAAATGFAIDNNILIIAGSLVGASGLILTKIMCKAMNRSLTNVLFGVMDGGSSSADAGELYANVRSTSANEVAMILDTAERVVFVPGYGMAVAQAQHAVRDLANLITERGGSVEYAIHPVAGRMPGHMNVLLAEADVPYEQLIEMDNINPTMAQVDVAIVIGANDVVNPVARTDPKSPIAGMPIIDVDKARSVIVIKRSLSPGFAQIPNPLFAAENTLMLFGDGKKAVLEIVSAIKEG